MSGATPRLRIFAGPNGSGKSTLKAVLPPPLLGVYLNPDEIEQEVRDQRFLDLSTYGVSATPDEVAAFFANSDLLNSAGLAESARNLTFAAGRIGFGNVAVNSYFASAVADFLRQKLLKQKASFTLETVMSHPSKLDVLQRAREAGYRTYLYFIATDDPEINISRVRNRVSQGGHAVPEDKIKHRYYRSLDLLMEAIRRTDRAYIFDNSGDKQKHTWLAEITGGQVMELKADTIPAWFKRSVMDKIK